MLIEEKSIILACDSNLQDLKNLINKIDLSCIGAFKIGAALALEQGLAAVVSYLKLTTGKPIIYDHQKAGTDTDFTAPRFMEVMKNSGIDSIILFPQAGPKTYKNWVKEARLKNLHIIVGGLMTHDQYLSSEGGYIQDSAIFDIYGTAASMGIKDIVVPGNKPFVAQNICKIMELNGNFKPNLYMPGYKLEQIVDPICSRDYNFHLIVGRSIFNSRDPNLELIKWHSRLLLMGH